MTFASPEAAYDHGIGALQSGHPELAIKALEYAADHDIFLAQFYLARVFADNALASTDHGRAFALYQTIADEHADVDPDDDQRAPFVAKSLTALASYVKSGIPAIGLQPNARRAAEYVRHAATSLRDEDAQFELAKLLLKGDGIAANPQEALYWLSGLSKKGHTGAQAFLADLYWRGQHVGRDHTQALLLITLAVENAPASERVWIEDKFQNIFCGAGEGVRQQAQGAVAEWRTKYGRANDDRGSRDGLGAIQPRTVRECSNGELVTSGRRGEASATSNSTPAPMPNSARTFAPAGAGVMQGNTLGFGLRDAGQTTTSPVR